MSSVYIKSKHTERLAVYHVQKNEDGSEKVTELTILQPPKDAVPNSYKGQIVHEIHCAPGAAAENSYIKIQAVKEIEK